jgi:LysM repeat protein
LLKIASSFGVTVRSIQQLNNLGTSTRIRVDDVLLIPSSGSTPTASPTPTPTPTQRTYIVKSGDTLISIARRFGVTVDALSKLNSISNPNSIRIGQELKIPS